MAFWKDVGERLSEATGKTIQKTRNLTDTARLNGRISEDRRTIDALLLEIGHLYIRLYGDQPEPAFVQLVSQVKNAEARIVNCQEQIRQINGMVICSDCGAEIPGMAAICPVCGAQQSDTSLSAVICTTCGAEVPAGNRFCTNCGKPVEASQDPVATSVAAGITSATAAHGDPICTACGLKTKTAAGSALAAAKNCRQKDRTGGGTKT